MVDPFTAATGAVAAADTLYGRYERAQAAAKTQDQKDAGALVYFAAQLATAVAALDLEFRTMLNEISRLDPAWSKERRDQLADAVRALATKELRLNQIATATAFLQALADEGSGWRERILHRGGRDANLDEALDFLLDSGKKVLGLIGADRQAGTPYEVDRLERHIRGSEDQETIDRVKAEATAVLSVIDRLTARSVGPAFGRFASEISRKHGISAPDWASVQ